MLEINDFVADTLFDEDTASVLGNDGLFVLHNGVSKREAESDVIRENRERKKGVLREGDSDLRDE
jgi:hypothetical protein